MLPRRAFNRVDLVVIATVLVLLTLVIFIKTDNQPQTAKVLVAKQDIRLLQNAVNLYYLDNQIYPTEAQGLAALLQKPDVAPIPSHYPKQGYLKILPVDPWGNAYLYRYPGQEGTFDIYSGGASAKTTSKLANKPIGNWQLPTSGAVSSTPNQVHFKLP